jgi:hypothetical protein
MQDQQLQQAFFLISLTIDDMKKRLAVVEEKTLALEQIARSYAENQSSPVGGSAISPGDSNGKDE